MCISLLSITLLLIISPSSASIEFVSATTLFNISLGSNSNEPKSTLSPNR